MRTAIGKIIYIMIITLIIWFSVSYIEILAKNTEEHPIYCSWNLLTHVLEGR